MLRFARYIAFMLGIAGSQLALTEVAHAQQEPEVVSVKKIWDEGTHSAFTDLIRWRDKWYCSFREGEGHVGGDGKLRVLESTDGDRWQSVALLEEAGIDLRDPKLSITPDDRLMIVAGGSVYGGTKTLKGRQPRVAFSKDGRQWTKTQRVLDEGQWLWRVTWHDGTAYGVTYNSSAKPDWTVHLVSSKDGVNYDVITQLEVPGRPNETTVRILPDGEMIAMVRREAGQPAPYGWIGSSRPPYQQWNWNETGERFGGPNFIQLPDGTFWAGSRKYVPQVKTALGPMTRENYAPVVTLPSGGDTSYPGLVWHDGLLWVSYYSSHEGKSNIYLAKIRIPEKE